MRSSTARMVVLALGLTCGSAYAASVSVTEVPGQGNFHGINVSGQIVGSALAGDALSAFVYADRTSTVVFAPSANIEQTEAFGISKDGTVVGSFTVDGSSVPTHGFSFVRGTVRTIGYPGAQSTVLRGINDAHTMVGYYRDRTGGQHGFLYDQTNFTPIDVPGAVNTFAMGINNAGEVVGYYTAMGRDGQYHDHGFLYARGGELRTVDMSASGSGAGVARDTRCYGINTTGIIVGTFIDAGGTHGFVGKAGAFLVVDVPGTPPGVGTFIEGVNDLGQLAIHGATSFIGTYVP